MSTEAEIITASFAKIALMKLSTIIIAPITTEQITITVILIKDMPD